MPIRTEAADGVVHATIDAPPINLLDAALLSELDALGREVEADDRVRVLVLRSANPDFFIAHGDVASILEMPRAQSAPERPDALPWIHACIDRLRTMPKVTIAQIEGYARGGGAEVALACDMRFAAHGRAVLGQPEIGLGILPGAGGTTRLVQLLGRARAAEVLLGGDDFTADEAELMGWVNRALPEEDLGPYVDRLAARIASFPARAIAEIKQQMTLAEADLQARLCAEQQAFDRCMQDEDTRLRMRRWLERDLQTPEGERRIGAQLDALGHDPGEDEA